MCYSPISFIYHLTINIAEKNLCVCFYQFSTHQKRRKKKKNEQTRILIPLVFTSHTNMRGHVMQEHRKKLGLYQLRLFSILRSYYYGSKQNIVVSLTVAINNIKMVTCNSRVVCGIINSFFQSPGRYSSVIIRKLYMSIDILLLKFFCAEESTNNVGDLHAGFEIISGAVTKAEVISY